MSYTQQEVMQFIEEEDVKFIRLTFCDVYGKLTVYYDDMMIGETDIVAAQDIDRQLSNYILRRAVNAIRNHLILFIVIVVVLIIVILILVDNKRRRRARAARHRR